MTRRTLRGILSGCLPALLALAWAMGCGDDKSGGDDDDDDSEGISCSVGGSYDGCTCRIEANPNSYACDTASVSGGVCCAEAGWPNSGRCECFPVSCTEYDSSAIPRCECERGTSGGDSSCEPMGGHCCDFASAGCNCYSSSGSCDYGDTVASCSASTMGCSDGWSRVGSCSN